MILTTKQTKVIDLLENKTHSEVYFGGAAGGGKSLVGCYWILKNCMLYAGSRWVIGRAKLKRLKESTLKTFFEVCKMQGIGAEYYKYNAQDNTIIFVNGSEVLLKDLFAYPSDQNFESLGSLEISGAFLEEVSEITEKAKNVLKSRIRYGLKEYDIIPKLFGTCNPSKNWLYQKIYKPWRNDLLPDYITFLPALVQDNPHIAESYIESLKNLDRISRERLLFGNWEYDNAPDALIDYEAITKIFNSRLPSGKKYISADIARYGKDKTVIYVWHGLQVIHVKILSKASITDSAYEIKKLKELYNVPLKNVIVDSDGVGGGTADILGCQGFINNNKPLNRENFNHLKSQCYFKLADLINDGEISIQTDDISFQSLLIEELEQVRQKHIDKDSKKAVIDKATIKSHIGRSPDYSDALMMRMYYEIKRKRRFARIY